MQKVISANEQLLKQGEGLVQALLPLVGNQAAIGRWFTANSGMLTQLQDASNSATKSLQRRPADKEGQEPQLVVK